jgi:hypothetical protein
MMRNKEQLLRSKAMLAEGLEQELKLRTSEIAFLQRRLYDCKKNK